MTLHQVIQTFVFSLQESATYVTSTHQSRPPSLGQVHEHVLKVVSSLNGSPPTSTIASETSSSFPVENNISERVLSNITTNALINSNIANTINLLSNSSSGSSMHDTSSSMKTTSNHLPPTSFNSSRTGSYVPRESLNMNHINAVNSLSNIVSIANSNVAIHSNSPASIVTTSPVISVPTSCSTPSTGKC